MSVGAHGVDELARELLDRRVAHAQPGSVAGDVVADRVQQVGLAEPRRTVQEERVVRLRRQLGDGERGGVGEAVAAADDELLERVLRVQRAWPEAAVWRRADRRPAAGPEPAAPGCQSAPTISTPASGSKRLAAAWLEQAQVALGRPRCGCARARARRGCVPSTRGQLERLEPDVELEVGRLPAQLGRGSRFQIDSRRLRARADATLLRGSFEAELAVERLAGRGPGALGGASLQPHSRPRDGRRSERP